MFPEASQFDGRPATPVFKLEAALAALSASRGEVVVLDGEVSNSTHSEEFQKAFPERFFEIFIAEQQMIAAAVGPALVGKMPFASTFAAFLTRAYDHIRMAAISDAALRLCGSHAGVSIGEDGPSQMALEDLAMMRAVCGSTVLYPCDANQTARLLALMAETRGISYVRTTRGKTDIIYDEHETFAIGGSKVLKQSERDDVAVVAAGITVQEALKAYRQLDAESICLRVIDAYSVKPTDRPTLVEARRAAGGRMIVVEDHWLEGGLCTAVLEALAAGEAPDMASLPTVVQLAVRDMPSSGTPDELLAAAGIDAEHIASASRTVAIRRVNSKAAS